MKDESKALIGRERICKFLEIGKQAFYDLVDEGLPVVKRGKRWSGHKDDLNEFFRFKEEREKHPG